RRAEPRDPGRDHGSLPARQHRRCDSDGRGSGPIPSGHLRPGNPDEVGPERPRRRPARRPGRAGEEPVHPHPRVPEDPRGEPGYEIDDRRDGSVHGEVLRLGGPTRPLRGRDLHRIRPRRGPAEVLRGRGRLRDRLEVRDPGPRRPGGAGLRPAGGGGEQPGHTRVRQLGRERRPVLPERRRRLCRGGPAMPPGPGFHAGGRPGCRSDLFRGPMHTPPRTGVRAPRGRVTGMLEPSAAPARTTSARNASVSVIIPTWNEAKYLPTLLDSLQNQTRSPLEILIADSESIDGTQDLAEARGALLVPGDRRGSGEGRNREARAARGALFLFVDADCVTPPDLLDAVVAAFDEPGVNGGATHCMPAAGTPAGGRARIRGPTWRRPRRPGRA